MWPGGKKRWGGGGGGGGGLYFLEIGVRICLFVAAPYVCVFQ